MTFFGKCSQFILNYLIPWKKIIDSQNITAIFGWKDDIEGNMSTGTFVNEFVKRIDYQTINNFKKYADRLENIHLVTFFEDVLDSELKLREMEL